MEHLTIIYWCSVCLAGFYMLGLGYSFLPDPGVKDSESNKEHFNKYRKLFKRGGIATVIYVLLSLANNILLAQMSHNYSLHRTQIPLRSICAGEFRR